MDSAFFLRRWGRTGLGRVLALALALGALGAGCSDSPGSADSGAPADAGVQRDGAPPDSVAAADAGPDALPPPSCKWVDAGVGPAGATRLTVEQVVTGLEIPWALAFPSSSEILVTEMAGRVRLVRNGKLVATPVLTIGVPGKPRDTGQGLHGIALHPQFAQNRLFYLHHTVKGATPTINRVVRYKLSADSASATLDRVILDNIPAGFFHNGGHMSFGQDRMLYVSTGDANTPDNGKDPTTLAGKLLRLTAEGKVPADNPTAGSPVLLSGIRNSQGFDFLSARALYVVDHGPSGEHNGSGQDELTLATFGDDLGWPTISGCSAASGKLQPSLSWKEAVPPGSVIVYRGSLIPGWDGSVLMTSLGQQALLRVVFDPKNARKVTSHEVYIQGDTKTSYGRLRALAQGPDGQLYVTTSNCDDHGTCVPKDSILRIKSQ